MKQHRIIIFLVLFLVVIHNLATGQSSIKSGVDKNRILLGEVFQLSIEASIKKGSNEKFKLPNTIPHFEFVDTPQVDTSSIDNGILVKSIYRLTSFDSGRWSIPSFSLSARLRTDSIPIDVVFSEFDPGQEYHDIKDIIEVESPRKKMKWWWFVVAAVLLGLILLIGLKKKSRPVQVTAKMSVNPYEEAMRQLNELKKMQLPSKQFYSRITDIFRTYVFKRKGTQSLQKTTADLVLQLKDLNFEKAEFEKLAQILRLSDFVKFAKYEPSNDDDELTWNTIRDMIEIMENKERKLPVAAPKA